MDVYVWKLQVQLHFVYFSPTSVRLMSIKSTPTVRLCFKSLKILE